MPNNLDSNVSQIVLKKFLPGFMSDLVLAKTVDRQLLAGEINSSTGDSVSFKRPHQFSSLRTPTGDISGQNKNNLLSGKATGRVGNYITVAVEYQQLEEAIKLNQLEEILAPVRQRIVTDLETELAHFMMNNGALSLGSPNTPITKWSDVAQTASFLKDLGVNEGENYAVMDPWSAQRLADAQTGLHASDQLVRTAWENAQIPTNFGGIRALMSNGLASRTQGAFGGTLTVKTQPTVTYNAVKDSYQFTVTLTGATASVTGFLKAGDQVKFTNTYWLQQQTKQALYNGATPISFTATVTADANSDSSGDVTVTLSGVPIYDTTNPQYNSVSRQVEAGDAVSVVGTASQTMKPNLFYNKFFCGLGSIPLPKLHSIDSAVATYEGFSIRVVGLDSRLTTAENDIDYLTDEVVAIQNTLSDHETRIDALEYATTRKKSEVVYSGVSVTIPTAPTNLVSLLKTLTPSSGTLAPFFDTVNNKMVVFNENKTLFFKLSIVGTWPSGTANRSMQLTFSGSVPDTLVSSRNVATTTDNILLATFFSVDKDGFLATNGSTLTIQSNGAAFTATTIKIIAEQ